LGSGGTKISGFQDFRTHTHTHTHTQVLQSPDVSHCRDEFVKWFNVQCVSRWNNLCSAETWAGRFMEFYSTDEALKSILMTRRTDGFEIIKAQLKEKVGNDGVGLVVDEIVTKLEDLSKSGRFCMKQLQKQGCQLPVPLLKCLLQLKIFWDRYYGTCAFKIAHFHKFSDTCRGTRNQDFRIFIHTQVLYSYPHAPFQAILGARPVVGTSFTQRGFAPRRGGGYQDFKIFPHTKVLTPTQHWAAHGRVPRFRASDPQHIPPQREILRPNTGPSMKS